MSNRIVKLGFVAAVAVLAACASRESPESRIEQGCCWKKEGSTVTCSAPTLKRDCESPFTWVKDKGCRDKECGAA